GVGAVLAGVKAEEPALASTLGLGKLLYAALTAHWPGGEWPSLPAAPEMDGHSASPRQVRAGVPTGIDDVACRVLFQRTADGNPLVTTPATLATALNRVIPAPAAPPPAPGLGGDATRTRPPPTPAGPAYTGDRAPPRARGRGPRTAAGPR